LRAARKTAWNIRDGRHVPETWNCVISGVMSPFVPSFIVNQFAGMTEEYIADSRKKYHRNAVPLTDQQKAAMAPFFPAEILDKARLRQLNGKRVEDPGFYGMARMLGFSNLPFYSEMAAVTYVDTIVLQEEVTDALLFHELVHVVQYEELGIKEFSSLYVHGFMNGGSYEEIPLEKNAAQLEKRFKKAEPFSVEDAVKKAIAAGKY
jgi:hypothetical protein